MTKITNRAPVRALDDYGREVVRVPLSRGGDAIVDPVDFDRLMRLGLTKFWFLNAGGYVRATKADTKGRVLGVARIIVNARAGEVVKYNDGDPTNLRRRNLYTKLGNAKRYDALILSGRSVHRLFIKPAQVEKEAQAHVVE